MRRIMASLDVGSDSVKLVVGEITKKKLNILASSEIHSDGIKEGLVVDSESLIKDLQEVFHRCEETIGLKIRQVVVSVPAIDSKCSVVTGEVEINSDGGIVTGKDIIRSIKVSLKTFNDDMYEIVSVIPTSFVLDDGRTVKDPKGLSSKTLMVRGVLVSAPKNSIYPVLSCLDKINIEVIDISLGIVGSYYEFKNKDLDNQVGAVVNLGNELTTIGIFNKGIITNSNVIPIGGKNIDNDISFIYKTSINQSKKLKEDHAIADRELASKSDMTNIDGISLSQYELSNVVVSRLEELLNLCKKEINNLTKKEISYIIFTGGLAECKEFRTLVDKLFGYQAKVGNIFEIGVRNNKYSTCLGIIKYYANDAKLKDKDYSIFSIEEQRILGGANLDSQNENKIGKLFGYIFNG